MNYEKAHLIDTLTGLKQTAIEHGFDWPSQNPQEATTEELKQFLVEVEEFIEGRQK